MRRLLSIVLAAAMVFPAFASVAEAATATWLSPQPGESIRTSKAEVAVGFNTQSKLKVSSLELWIDGKFYARRFLREPASRGVGSFIWDTSRATRGSHDLVIRIYAGDELISTVSGTGTVDSTGSTLDTSPPVVTFGNIKEGDVLKGTTEVEINATDDSGEPPMVSLLVDDVLKLLRNTPPYAYSLDTTTYPDGDHQLKTYAYDVSGNRSDPTVIKVAFRNGLERPVVAAMVVDTHPDPVVPETKAVEMPKSLPKVAPSPAPVPAKQEAAGRTEDAREESAVSAFPLTPVLITSEPTIRMGPPAAPSSASQPAKAADPTNLNAEASIAGNLRSEHDLSMASPFAAEPRLADDADTADVARVSAAAAPEIVPEPEPEKRVAMAALGKLRAEDKLKVMGFAAATPEEVLSDAAVSDIKNVVASRPIEGLKVLAEKCNPSEGLAAPAAPEEMDTAMASDIGPNAQTGAAVKIIPPTRKDAKARLEKSTIPASGKVQARTLFENLGGVLFWDASTHTVTIFAQGMRIDLEIGSNVARVNGTEMLIDVAPYVVDGRTMIDARVYHQACALVEHAKITS